MQLSMKRVRGEMGVKTLDEDAEEDIKFGRERP
jgi:hypothetical protein